MHNSNNTAGSTPAPTQPIFSEQIAQLDEMLAALNQNNDRLTNFSARLMQQSPEKPDDPTERPPSADNVQARIADCLERFTYALNAYGRLLIKLERGV